MTPMQRGGGGEGEGEGEGEGRGRRGRSVQQKVYLRILGLFKSNENSLSTVLCVYRKYCFIC